LSSIHNNAVGKTGSKKEQSGFEPEKRFKKVLERQKLLHPNLPWK